MHVRYLLTGRPWADDMLKVILQEPRHISPFNEAARDLRIQNKPLWLNQRDLLALYVDSEIELAPGSRLPVSREPMIVYRDNLFFDVHYITEFMSQAIKQKRAVRAAFSMTDAAFREHARGGTRSNACQCLPKLPLC